MLTVLSVNLIQLCRGSFCYNRWLAPFDNRIAPALLSREVEGNGPVKPSNRFGANNAEG